MKIAIVGKGISAIITTLVCLSRGHEVEIYFDPDIPHLSVGESTTPHIGILIKDVLGISIGDLNDAETIAIKFGVLFEKWGTGKSFIHHFHSNQTAFHFDTKDLNAYLNEILENEVGIKYHASRVDGYTIDSNRQKVLVNGNEYDFLISCAGWKDSSDYKKPLLDTVDSVVLFAEENCNCQPYTIHKATEDGWQFGIGYPKKNQLRNGYLFNSNDISAEEVKKKLGKEDARSLSWEPRYRKRMIENNYCAYNGNMLMFLDPIQALSLYYYYLFAKSICNFLDDRRHETLVRSNQTYHQYVMQNQIGMAWHYSYGSIFKSKFWDRVVEQSKRLLDIKFDIDEWVDAYNHDQQWKSSDLFRVGCFSHNDYRQVHFGMTGEPVKFKDTSTYIF